MKFIIVGENVHCTRVYKVGGRFVKPLEAGDYVIEYSTPAGKRRLPVPSVFTENADRQSGKVKHCAVAIWQGCYGDDAGKVAGIDYLRNLAVRQESAGTAYLDVNVDEFSTDEDERVRLMKWTVETVQQAVSIPVSVDSSNAAILRAGLESRDTSRGRAMVNSVSLERTGAIDLAAEFNAVVIASAAGEKDLPSAVADRMRNIDALIQKLIAAGFEYPDIHVDPLVFPISTDGNNGKNFLNTVSAVREKYGGDIHIIAGLSNVSFGMPNRKLINQVYARLAVESGADGGIVDPLQINAKTLEAMDPESEPYELARALLMGEDEYGMNFISACRDERI